MARASKDYRAKEIIDLGNHLFTKKMPLNQLHQEIAWQFCPDLAEFTTPLQLGEDWGSDRMDSFPEQASRELCNQVGVMLRPSGKPWAKASTGDDELDADEENAQFLEYISRTMRRELYKRSTGFVAATKEADRFYVNFGQAVISIEESPRNRSHLYFRNHHIKDCVWLDNELGEIDHLHRKQTMTARQMKRMFGAERLHKEIVTAAQKEPNREFEVRFVTMPIDEYYDFTAPAGEKAERRLSEKRFTHIICVIDVENCCTIKEGGLVTFNYCVPRWMRMTGSQYAFSPATMTALADGRMAQMLAQILLESGEKAIDPPMVGKKDVVIGEPSLAAGGLSWIDIEHDKSLKEALDVIKIDADMRVGFQMRLDLREMLSKAFYLDKLNLPQTGAGEMTAFEVARRLEEHVRNLLPIFEPVQVDYNAKMLDISFDLLVNMKAIDFERMPDALSDVDTGWEFETPIQQAESRLLVEAFMETINVIAVGKQAGITTEPVHLDRALRDAVRGVGGPAYWRKTVEEHEADAEAQDEEMQAQDAMMKVGGAAQTAEQVGNAGQALGIIQPPAPAGRAPAGGGAPAEGAPAAAAPAGGLPEGIDMSAALAALGGSAAAAGGMPQQGAPAMPTPASPELLEMRQMMRRMMMMMSNLEEAVSKPKRISVTRDKSGKITGATAGHEQGAAA